MTAISILLYHSVGDAPSEECRPWYVSVDAFAEQLLMIEHNGFTCLTVSALVDAIDTGTLPTKPLAITFDDGGADFVASALPLLARHSMPSTMYVPSTSVGRFVSWSRGAQDVGREIMSWDVLQSLDPGMVEIGAHSATHPQLDVVASAQRRNEIFDSRAQLQEGLNRSVRSFAYPHGYHSATVRRLVREAGFDSATACGNRWSHIHDDRFALSRLTVFNELTAETLQAIVNSPPNHQPTPRHIPRFGWRCVRRVQRRFAEVKT